MPPDLTLNRWLRYNTVGAGGIVVQLAVLAILTRLGEMTTVAATVLAVEAAVLHNFYWHHRWTWRDRPAAGTREFLVRLVRFHALNGAVSIAGNVVITVALTRLTPLDPVAANIVAIATCSVLNYTASHMIVFRATTAMLLAALALDATPAAAQAQSALAAWQGYSESVDRRHGDAARTPFFALDGAGIERWRERARAGEIPMAEIEPPGVPGGKLHHWTGAVFVPNATVDAVVKRIQDAAGHESKYYDEVKASRLLARNGNSLRVFMRLYRDAGPVSATYNTEHQVDYRNIGDARWTNRSVATKIAELANPGTPREREKAPGDDNGFLWKLNAYWRYEQWGDGVLIECESVSLSRSVPFLLRPIANPIVDRIARESLQRTLHSLRRFLTLNERRF